MLLADSNIFIDYWKNPTAEMTDVFRNENVVICGIVRAGLLHGAVSEKNFKEISAALDLFDSLEISENDWNIFGRYLFTLRSSGLTVPFSDALIAYVAIKYDAAVWTRDRHFNNIQGVFKNLKLL